MRTREARPSIENSLSGDLWFTVSNRWFLGERDILMRTFEEQERQRREDILRLSFFDAGIWIGRPQGFPLAHACEAADLPAILKKHFLTGGLVSHWRGKAVSAQDGNESLTAVMEERSNPDLFAVWTGLPLFPRDNGLLPGNGEPPAVVKAVRIFPRTHNFPLAVWSVGTLMAWLHERHIPLLLFHTECAWNDLFTVAQAFPSLPVIVETQTQKILYHTRPLFALMKACPNIRVELSNLCGAGMLEYTVREFGADRLIYGSFLPVGDPLVPIGMVVDAAISEQEKKAIAGENLRRLIAEVRHG